MTIQEYKQQLYDACKEHIFLAQQALDRYSTAKTDREREYAKIDNLQHLAAHNALQWALYKASELENMGSATYERKHFHDEEEIRRNPR